MDNNQPAAPAYRLVVRQLKNGKYEHRVLTAAGAEVGRRTSNNHYVSATVLRNNRESRIKSWQSSLGSRAGTWSTEYLAHCREELSKARQMQTDGTFYPATVYSFNSRPTALPSRLAQHYDFLGFALEGRAL